MKMISNTIQNINTQTNHQIEEVKEIEKKSIGTRLSQRSLVWLKK